MPYTNEANLFRGATWASAVNWLNWRNVTPYYYDSSGYPYEVTQAEEKSLVQQPSTSAIAEAQPEADWMPLGVYALGQNVEQMGVTHRFLQLAMNRQGKINGIFYNSLNDKTQNITGLIDKDSQQVYFQFAYSSNSPIASTGLYNLTEDQTALKVNFNDGSEQTWIMVRLER